MSLFTIKVVVVLDTKTADLLTRFLDMFDDREQMSSLAAALRARSAAVRSALAAVLPSSTS